LLQELDQVKNDYTGLSRDTISSFQHSQDEQGAASSKGGVVSRVTLDDRKKLAVEMYKGCDSLFDKH
jgi:hypothetical protein